jgi:hypothetical protein
MKAGRKFEELTQKIFTQLVRHSDYEKVEHDVMLDGKDGPRQIDVLIASSVAGMEIKTIVECKDYKSKVSVGVIDSLHSVMEDVNANKGVVVSANGFSSKAKSKAKRLGISLYTAHEALSEKWKIDIEVPIVVTEILPLDVHPSLTFTLKAETTFNKTAILQVNDFPLDEEFRAYWKSLSEEDIFALRATGNIVPFENIVSPFFIRDLNANKLAVHDCIVNFGIKRNYYFGYISEQEGSIALKNILDGDFNLIFKVDALINYKQSFRKVFKDDIPQFGQVYLNCLAKPELDHLTFDSIEIQKVG